MLRTNLLLLILTLTVSSTALSEALDNNNAIAVDGTARLATPFTGAEHKFAFDNHLDLNTGIGIQFDGVPTLHTNAYSPLRHLSFDAAAARPPAPVKLPRYLSPPLRGVVYRHQRVDPSKKQIVSKPLVPTQHDVFQRQGLFKSIKTRQYFVKKPGAEALVKQVLKPNAVGNSVRDALRKHAPGAV